MGHLNKEVGDTVIIYIDLFRRSLFEGIFYCIYYHFFQHRTVSVNCSSSLSKELFIIG